MTSMGYQEQYSISKSRSFIKFIIQNEKQFQVKSCEHKQDVKFEHLAWETHHWRFTV